MPDERFTNRQNGKPQRGPDGRFLKGCRPGPGNPGIGRIAALRAALVSAVRPADIAKIIAKLVALAIDGDAQAANTLLNRIFGTPAQADLLERLERLEAAVAERNQTEVYP